MTYIECGKKDSTYGDNMFYPSCKLAMMDDDHSED